MAPMEHSAGEVSASRVNALVAFANNFLQGGSYEEALDTFDKAVAEDPLSLRGHLGRGLALARLGRFDDALAVADHMFYRLELDSPFAYIIQAVCYHQMGRDAEAEAAFRQAVRNGPTQAKNHYNFACYWACRRDGAKSRDCLAMALALDARLKAVAATDVDLAVFREEPWFQELVAFKTPPK